MPNATVCVPLLVTWHCEVKVTVTLKLLVVVAACSTGVTDAKMSAEAKALKTNLRMMNLEMKLERVSARINDLSTGDWNIVKEWLFREFVTVKNNT